MVTRRKVNLEFESLLCEHNAICVNMCPALLLVRGVIVRAGRGDDWTLDTIWHTAWPPGSAVVGVVVSKLLRLVNNEI